MAPPPMSPDVPVGKVRRSEPGKFALHHHCAKTLGPSQLSSLMLMRMSLYANEPSMVRADTPYANEATPHANELTSMLMSGSSPGQLQDGGDPGLKGTEPEEGVRGHQFMRHLSPCHKHRDSHRGSGPCRTLACPPGAWTPGDTGLPGGGGSASFRRRVTRTQPVTTPPPQGRGGQVGFLGDICDSHELSPTCESAWGGVNFLLEIFMIKKHSEKKEKGPLCELHVSVDHKMGRTDGYDVPCPPCARSC